MLYNTKWHVCIYACVGGGAGITLFLPLLSLSPELTISAMLAG